MIYFIGAGPGAVDLITVRGAEILRRADIIVYAGSLVNPELLKVYASPECMLHDSSRLTLDEIMSILIRGHDENLLTVRLHSGDPAIYGAIREQMNILRTKAIPFEIVPGVSSLFAASASLKVEYMIPEHTQTLIVSRQIGNTHVPESESLKSLACHKSSMVLFLSSGMVEKLCDDLIIGGYPPETSAALVYKASWPDERVIRATLNTLPGLVRTSGISKTALILVGDFLNDDIGSAKSRLYDKDFTHEFRR